MADLRDQWENFAEQLEDFAVSRGFTRDEAEDIGDEYAEAFQSIFDKFDDGEIDRDQLYDEWYEIYDDLIEEYDLDIHDEDFYPKGE